MRIFQFFLLVAFLAIIPRVYSADCFKTAQDFKCPYMHLQCNGESGECKCDDGTLCKWKGSEPTNDNCPCGDKEPEYRRKRRYRDL